MTDGRYVYMAMEGDYSRPSGALAVIDVETQRVEAYPQLVKLLNLASLAYDRSISSETASLTDPRLLPVWQPRKKPS